MKEINTYLEGRMNEAVDQSSWSDTMKAFSPWGKNSLGRMLIFKYADKELNSVLLIYYHKNKYKGGNKADYHFFFIQILNALKKYLCLAPGGWGVCFGKIQIEVLVTIRILMEI